MDLEGTLRIRLGVRSGRVASVRVTSTRPDAARLLLQGRRRSDIRAALPRLFSVCGHSQSVAGELACAVAAGEPVDDAQVRGIRAVSAEIVREYAWCVLLEWPRAIGEPPAENAIAAARAAETSRAQAGLPAGAAARAISIAAFGVDADAWLDLGSRRELDGWIDAGGSGTARFLRRMRDADFGIDDGTTRLDADVALLDGEDRRAAMAELWSACEADADFPRRPTRHGGPAETGALARLRSDPPIAELMDASRSRVFPRFVARLRELARLLAGREGAAVGVQCVSPGAAAAWVENARGLLVHQVRLEGDRAATYRIIAPTEWNFHPEGAVAVALDGAPATDRAALEQRAARTVRSLDPCVAWRVEFEDA